MSLSFKIYKHNRTILLFIIMALSIAVIVGQRYYFQSLTNNLNNTSSIVNHSSFSELETIKQVENTGTVKTPEPQAKVNVAQVPDRVINIGNNIKFIGFIKSNKKVFILVEYGGIEYNLKKGEAIKTSGSSDTIVFDKIAGDYATFKINNYKYRMSVKEKYTDIPLMAE